MNSNKIYQSILELLFNVIRNDKLKYFLLKNDAYKNMFVDLVNDLLTLEKEQDTNYKEQTWAATFGKAIVMITQEKQRFEKKENKSIEDIYSDYSNFLSFTENEFEIERNKLEKVEINFTKEDVLFDAKLSEATIKNYDDFYKKQEEEKLKVEEEMKNKESQNNSNAEAGAGFGGTNNFNGNQQNGNPYVNIQDFYASMPQNPMADPRFYPYDRKPKWMKWAKYALGSIGVLATIILIIASAIAMSASINLKNDAGELGIWKLKNLPEFENTDWTSIANIDAKFNLIGNQNIGFGDVITYIFFLIPAIYLALECFRKPRNLREKYRIAYWPVVFTILFYGLSIMWIYKYISVGEIKDIWHDGIKNWTDDFVEKDFNQWWDKIVDAKHIKAISALMDVAIAFLGLTIILGLIIVIMNPKMDRNKIAKANFEFQSAMAAKMQGQHYEMDPSIYESDEEVIIKNKNKFELWLEKTFKRNKKKNKDK